MELRVHSDRSAIRLPRAYRFGFSAVSALAMATLLPQAAQAQEAPADEGDGADIVVSGIRHSLATSINTKRNTQSIVEVVSAEEIGKLPDVSIAESIARLPGLAAQRVGGRAQIIAVRGMAPDFTTVLLNGRQQASSGYNRSVEFDQYPSELLASAVVYKTPDADVSGMGLAGTVDLRTVRPLAYGKRVVSVNLRAEYDQDGGNNADFSQWGGRGSISYIDQNDAGTLGWSIGFAHLDAPSHANKFKAWDWEPFGHATTPDTADAARHVGGQDVLAQSSRNKRDGVMGTLEWMPSDSVHTTLDLYYSRFKQDSVTRGASYWSNGWADSLTYSNVQTTPIGADLASTSEHINNVVPILHNDDNYREDKLFAVGWNGEFQVTDRLQFTADLSYSSNTRDESNIETYAGYGAGPFQTRTRDHYDVAFDLNGFPTYSGFGLNYADAAQVSLGDRAPWGGWGHDGLLKKPHIKETILSVDYELAYELDGPISRIDVGVNYTHRDKTKTVEEIDLMLKNNRAQVLVGTQFLVAPTNLDFAGWSNTLAWDVRSGLDTYFNQVQLFDSNHFDKSWHITEDLLTFRAKANIDAGNLHGNIGIQVIQQSQGSEGLRINATANPITLAPSAINKSYTDILPSLNLYYDLGGGLRVRLAAAKVMARPRMDDMRANFTPGFNTSKCSGNPPCSPGATIHPWSASGGNPNLEPWRAKALDVSLEWYGGKATYIGINGFYKWIDNYIYDQKLPADFSEFPIPTNNYGTIPVIISPMGTIDTPENGKGGYLRGVEFSAAIELGRVVPLLDGFGFSGSVSYTDSDLNPTATTKVVRIPGLSNWVYNLTGYFEKGGFQARASFRHRSAFKGEVVGLWTNLTPTEILPDDQLDAQIGYTFPEGSSLANFGVTLQVSNVLDSAYRTRIGIDTDGRHTTDGLALPERYETYGRQFLLGLSYKF